MKEFPQDCGGNFCYRPYHSQSGVSRILRETYERNKVFSLRLSRPDLGPLDKKTTTTAKPRKPKKMFVGSNETTSTRSQGESRLSHVSNRSKLTMDQYGGSMKVTLEPPKTGRPTWSTPNVCPQSLSEVQQVLQLIVGRWKHIKNSDVYT